LKAIQKEAVAKQKTHLEALISTAAITQDKCQKKLRICLKRAEEPWQCNAMVCSITKLCQQGLLSHVKISKANVVPSKPP